MKTLKGYIVIDRLYTGDTGPEAVVGDEIKLYLDTEANTGFPEYIVGTIQHPITRVNCNTATSYSVEYDEADLDDAAAFLRVADIVDATITTAAEGLRDDLDAGTVGPLQLIGTAWVGGDQTGNDRGAGAIDIQSERSAITQVASGQNAVALGKSCTSSGIQSVAIGNACTAADNYNVAIGQNCGSEGGDGCTAIGYLCGSNGFTADAVSMGWQSITQGERVGAIGRHVNNTADDCYEFGMWSSSTVRVGAIRFNLNGSASLTLPNTATAPTDGGATKGDEANGTLMREGYAIRRNGNDLLIDVNVGGVIKTLSLGTAV